MQIFTRKPENSAGLRFPFFSKAKSAARTITGSLAELLADRLRSEDTWKRGFPLASALLYSLAAKMGDSPIPTLLHHASWQFSIASERQASEWCFNMGRRHYVSYYVSEVSGEIDWIAPAPKRLRRVEGRYDTPMRLGEACLVENRIQEALQMFLLAFKGVIVERGLGDLHHANYALVHARNCLRALGDLAGSKRITNLIAEINELTAEILFIEKYRVFSHKIL